MKVKFQNFQDTILKPFNITPVRRFLLFLIAGISFSITASSQPLCGFDSKMKELKLANPQFVGQLEENEQYIRNYIAAHPENMRGPRVVYTIPVVVHVMHTGDAVGSIYNPSDADIMGAIDYLNQVYAGTYPGMEAPVGGSSVVDMELQFVLARSTPSCGYTNGIERVDASGIPNYIAKGVNANNSDGVPELQIKNYARWDPANYYNIWVVNKIDGKDGTSGQFTAGYAYFAGAPANLDGTVMLATQMRSGAKTLPHEIGHAFSLYHVFEGSQVSTACPANTDCATDGDRVCDTDPVSKNSNSSGVINFTCRTGVNSCTGGAYTKNTEHNFMGYTYCYTLFTNGQKARVQAAMTLPGRASLLASPGLTSCGPVINFNVASAIVTESSNAQVDCRKYKDYTYSLTIGDAPSASADATLSYSGTATRGLDYEVTTNGDFSSPGNVLTFAAGSNSPKEFTVRVFDDANVEPSETIIINFTLNTGGDAVKGTINPTLTLHIDDHDAAPVSTSSGVYQVGQYVANVSEPFNSGNQKERGQFLYKASELSAAGLTSGAISSMQLYVATKKTSGSFNNFTIRVGQSASDYLFDGGGVILGSDFTTVYSTPSLSTVAGWNTFTFSTPYQWDGFSNIVVEYCFSSSTGSGADNVAIYSDGGGSTQSNFIQKAGIDCSTGFSSFNYYGSGYKPQIRFGLDVTGTEVETSTAGNQTEFLGIGSNDYFYSSSGKIIANIKNLSAEPGCVQVSVVSAGTTWVPLGAGNRSAKVFQIEPSANGSATSYSLSLYFTADELNGRSPSNLKIAKTSAANLSEVNASNTIIVTPTVTMLGTNAVFTGDFTGFSKFFLVDESFVLPVTLVSFTGKLNERAEAVLDWEVSRQYDFRGFDVERSNDGTHFSAIQNIPATQGYGSIVSYTYTDKNITEGANYYRLRMIDNDGHFTYSPVVRINYQGSGRFVSLAGNPVADAITVLLNNRDLRPVSATLFNVIGARIGSWHLGSRTGTVSLPIDQFQLTPGIYLLQISDGARVTTLKVQKK